MIKKAWWQSFMTQLYMMKMLYETIIYDDNIIWYSTISWLHSKSLKSHSSTLLYLVCWCYWLFPPQCVQWRVYLCIHCGYRALSHSPDYGGSPIPGWTLTVSRLRECCGTPVTDGLCDRSGLGPGLESPPVESREVLRSKH